MFGSLLTGWNANDNVYSTATTLSGPWSDWKTFATVGSNTYNSQTNFILPFGNGAIYLGDRWVSTNLMRSTYIWLPLTISGTTASMNDYVNWVPNVSASTWAVGPSETQPEGEAATLANGATSISCTGCSAGKAAGNIGGSSGGTVTFSGVSSTADTKTTIRIKHLNGDSSQRFATVNVNGVSQTVAFLPTADGNTPGSSIVHAQLKNGLVNTITISTTGGTWGPDVDRIMVPAS